jgi:heat-inducible transcriptional repressor
MRRDDRSDGSLDAREREILKSVIQVHIVTGEPIGSRTLSKETRLDLSAATIRNIMADLEERGLLSQPHTSAGRVPTDSAYRLYVDQLMGPVRMSAVEAQAIDEALLRTRGELPELLGEASRQLSRFSHHVGVALAPEFRTVVVEHIEFVRLEGSRVVAILVDRSGVVHNRILEVDEPLDQGELDRIGRFLSEQFSGSTLPGMREALLRRMAEETATCDRLLARTLSLGSRAVEPETPATGVFIEGASNLLAAPDFADVERLRALFRTLEEKGRLVELLGQLLHGPGVQIVIGKENPADLADCSIVLSTYGAKDRVLGRVGIVGPTRMEYARAVALVDYLARVLTRVLSGPGN